MKLTVKCSHHNLHKIPLYQRLNIFIRADPYGLVTSQSPASECHVRDLAFNICTFCRNSSYPNHHWICYLLSLAISSHWSDTREIGGPVLRFLVSSTKQLRMGLSRSWKKISECKRKSPGLASCGVQQLCGRGWRRRKQEKDNVSCHGDQTHGWQGPHGIEGEASERERKHKPLGKSNG